jgi:NTP pyrophosphatase (non-canonical NTP hydrolase)
MTFNDYQKTALTTLKVHPDKIMNQTIMAMGIAGEAGEVLEKWKKIVAYKDAVITPEDRDELAKEMGDVIWYIAVLADSLGLPLDQVIEMNITKLASRKQRDVIAGQGDNR